MPVCLNVCLGSAGDNVLLDEEGTHAKLTDFRSAENIQVRQCAHTRQAAEVLSDNREFKIYDATAATTPQILHI